MWLNWNVIIVQLVIQFCSDYLSIKLNALTRQWEVYSKEGHTSYVMINSYNFKPIFTQKQLVASIEVIVLLIPLLYIATVINHDTLYQDICIPLSSELTAAEYNPIEDNYFTDLTGLFLLDNSLYICHSLNSKPYLSSI